MDMKCCSKEGDLIIDIDCGAEGREEKDGESAKNHKHKVLNRVWSGFFTRAKVAAKEEEPSHLGVSCPDSVLVPIVNGESSGDKKIAGDNKSPSILESNKSAEKPKKKKKNSKKPSKPPRPPKGPLLDAADQEFVREISELAMLKRARIARMRALKKIKNTESASSYSNLWAFIITILFCGVIFWQGLSSKSSSNLSFEGSPVSSVENREGLISVQYYTNVSRSRSIGPDSASPDIAEPVSELNIKDEVSKAAK